GAISIEFTRDESPNGDSELRAAVGGDGSFESPSLAPGTYQLFLSLDHLVKSEHGGGRRLVRLQPALASVDVASGSTSRRELDGRDFDAGRVAGAVLVDGEPFGECRVFLLRVQDGVRYGQFVPDAQGRFEAGGLPPGTWKASLVVG